MCGIVGLINSQKDYDIDIILKSLYHRGPDDFGYYKVNENSFLGQTRLSIIDTSNHGHQPMVSKCGNYILVFNGEVYNHKELKKELEAKGYIFESESDTEVILNYYIDSEDKDKFLNKLRGMFAFCIYDKKNESYFFARDRFGIKPLIYSYDGDSLCFSSELKSLISSSLISKKIDKDALNDYLQYGSIVQPKTIYKDASYLMPSHYMVLDKNGLKITRYYSLMDNIKGLDVNYEEAVKITRNKLEEATRYHMVSDVEVGAFLSGGIDSSATVALMQKYSEKKIYTFCIGFKTGQSEVVDELNIAKKTSDILNTNHHEIVIDDKYINNIFDEYVSSMDQPSIDGLNTFIVSKEAATKVKVSISGIGGDEIFAGYPHFEKFSKYPEDKNNIFKIALSSLNKLRPNRVTDRFQYSGLSVEQRIDKLRTLDKILYNNNKIIKNNLTKTKVQRISLHEIDNYLLNTLLRDGDNFSMASSLEVRPVLLDHELVELALSLSDNAKVGKKYLKEIFIESVKDIIPEFVYKREKSGFVMPVVVWMNTILNNRFKTLLDGNFKAILDEKYLKQLRCRVNNKEIIQKDWKVFMLLAWLKKNEI